VARSGEARGDRRRVWGRPASSNMSLAGVAAIKDNHGAARSGLEVREGHAADY
jgi:hypothetical protein